MKRMTAWLGCALVALGAMTAAAPCRAGAPEHNKELVRRMVEAINDRDLDALDDLMAPDLRRHSAATEPLSVKSLEEFKAFLESDFEAVPDSRQEIELMLAEDDLVAVRVLYRGTQEGAWGPFPASGERVELPFMGILRIEDRKIVEIWVEWDNLYALRQLGHVEAPAESEGGAESSPSSTHSPEQGDDS